VTCISTAGNQAWIGGTVARIDSPDPADQELVGVDMWWRSIDNGQGADATPDVTTGLGFEFPAAPLLRRVGVRTSRRFWYLERSTRAAT
jgi:hypothetical protein